MNYARLACTIQGGGYGQPVWIWLNGSNPIWGF